VYENEHIYYKLYRFNLDQFNMMLMHCQAAVTDNVKGTYIHNWYCYSVILIKYV